MFGGGPLELRWCYNQLEYYNYSKEIIMNINWEKVYEREREINVNKQTKEKRFKCLWKIWFVWPCAIAKRKVSNFNRSFF